MRVKLFISDIYNYYPYSDIINTIKRMSHVINRDTIHSLFPSTHAILHETILPAYITIIAVIIIYIVVRHAKAVLFPLMNYI